MNESDRSTKNKNLFIIFVAGIFGGVLLAILTYIFLFSDLFLRTIIGHNDAIFAATYLALICIPLAGIVGGVFTMLLVWQLLN